MRYVTQDHLVQLIIYDTMKAGNHQRMALDRVLAPPLLNHEAGIC